MSFARWADMSGPLSKRQKVSGLLGLRHLTGVDVERVMGLLDGAGPAEVRWQIRYEVQGVQRDLVRCVILDGENIEIARLQTLLPRVMSTSQAYLELVTSALRVFPNSRDCPWRLVLYVDEITLGNVQKTANARRLNNVYASFLEFGLHLRDGMAWLPLACVRSTRIDAVKGLMSGLWDAILRDMFVGPSSIQDAGILIQVGAPKALYVKLERVIVDEAARKEIVGHKSASGILPCLECKNCIHNDPDKGEECGSLLEHHRGDYLVDITCTDVTRFDRRTNEDVWRAQDVLAAAARAGCPKGRFEMLEKIYGMSYMKHGLVADADLRGICKPLDVIRDPMHVTLGNGVMNIECVAVIISIEQEAHWEVFKMLEHLATAGWNASGGTGCGHVFNEYHAKSSKKAECLKCGASEVLAAYRIVRMFINDFVIPRGFAKAACDSFLALCHVHDLILEAKTFDVGQLPLAHLDSLDAAIMRYRVLHSAAHGDHYTKPKHHYLFHISESPRELRFWLDCFVHERKHIDVKAAVEHIDNTKTMEKSALSLVLLKHLAAWRRWRETALVPGGRGWLGRERVGMEGLVGKGGILGGPASTVSQLDAQWSAAAD